ncbi:chondroitin AC/alginate lyase-like protein [Phanerochaete sordida]|uniref:Chondroitin AC/alginate lyase-like protein n=1 Tax=Phanerochaete sordida TaxID=48140 RepID=A0A9P3FZB2_9APHY|nr:chondroitin AC/alginate lyase-like protein [Phanerochaete sordida]
MAARVLVTSLLLSSILGVAADINDWVNVNYVLGQSGGKTNGPTINAQNTVESKAASTAKNGPWIVATKGIKPPSGDPRDYLSWAPYHWPDCNWCSRGSTHFVSPNSTDPDSDSGSWDDPDGSGDSDPPVEPDGSDGDASEASNVDDLREETVNVNFLVYDSDPLRTRVDLAFGSPRRMRRVRRFPSYDGHSHVGGFRHARRQVPALDNPVEAVPVPTLLPTAMPEAPPASPLPPARSTSTSNRVVGTQAPAAAPAKTQAQKTSCTPSPTKSLAPSATWTTCPYVVRDGKVNPDTDELVGPSAAQDMSQSVSFNAIAYALQKNRAYSQNVASIIDAFFLSSNTGMHPNVNFGQLVRGPGKAHQIGTYTGILDLRGMVRVVNAIQLMRGTKSPDWTSAREQAMTSWTQSYVSWLQNSDLGKEVATKANNHLTFYINQLAATKFLTGDTKGATTTLQNYFSNQFLDQISQSGEQPFEAVRTRPFHYRCFNLEAMITNAKLGDQLGQNFWTAKSKYGATIQTALDYTMSVNPKGEDISDIFPHVAAVAAAYGDPQGKYAAFLQKHNSNYQTQPYWFYDQSAALPNSPAGKGRKRSDGGDGALRETGQDPSADTMTYVDPIVPAASQDSTIPFECPAVFENAPAVELEDGLYVTCDQLKPFFQTAAPIDTSNAV